MSIRSLRFLLFVFILLNCTVNNDDAGTTDQEIEQNGSEEFKVLFIGNSHTYFNQGIHFHLKRYVQQSSLAIEPIIEESTFGGHSLGNHLETTATIDKLKSKNWDIVVLQENSAVARDEQEIVVEHIKRFNDLIIIQGSETYLFMTWAYLEQPGMYFDIKNTYNEAVRAIRGKLVPVGTAFRTYLNDTNSDILYDGDGFHPSLEGTFLAATMFYIEIFNQDPRSNPYTAGLSDEMADSLKELAWTTLRGS